MQVAPEDYLALILRCQSNHSGFAGVEMDPFDAFPKDFDAFVLNANGTAWQTRPRQNRAEQVLVAGASNVGTPVRIGMVFART